jgi:hypothetical protein
MGKKLGSGPGIRILEEQLGSYFRELRNKFWVNIFLCGSGIGDGENSNPGSGMEKIRIRDVTLLPTLINDVIESLFQTIEMEL